MTRDDVLAWMEQNGITPTARCPTTFDGYVDLFEAVARRAFAAGAADNQEASGFLGEQLHEAVENYYKSGYAAAREAAAKVCESLTHDKVFTGHEFKECAARIRAMQ